MQKRGVRVYVGETGTPKTSPHNVYLAWMQDNLENWKAAGWGWALWNFRGEFGIFDSERADVEYEDFRGYKLDRKLLNLLQNYL
jgi:endoglucanase